MYALTPFIVTLTPSREVGIWLFTKSEACQVRESPAGARFVPRSATQLLGARRRIFPNAFVVRPTVGAEGVSKRILLFEKSAIYTFPNVPTPTLRGALSCALNAGPPSPADPATPFPAMVVMVPLVSITRIRLLPTSVM